MTAEHAKTSTEAKARGLSIYFTGNPCEHGHVAPRWAISKQCTVCQPMDRSREYVDAMRLAFERAFTATLKTGFLHVSYQDEDGWLVMPVHAEGGEEPATEFPPFRVDGAEIGPRRVQDGD